MSDSDNGEEEKWYVTVHRDRQGPYPDRASAYAAGRAARKADPNKHVAVVNPQGTSDPID
jgi:hypothetical protein